MAVKNTLINLDEYFNSITIDKKILNDYPYHRVEDRDLIINELQTINRGDSISSTPSCQCGKVKGMYKIVTSGTLVGCKECGTNVEERLNNDFQPTIWCRKLNDVPFINPKLWLLINKQCGSTIDTLLYLSTKSYRPKATIKPFLEKIVKSPEFERSYKYVAENLKEIVIFLGKNVPKKNRLALNMILTIMEKYEDCIYSEYLPIVGKSLYLKETNETNTLGTFVNKQNATAINNTFRFLKASSLKISEEEEYKVMANTISSSAFSTFKFFNDYMSGKFGGSRKLINASKSFLGARVVGSSITRSHSIEQVELPWSAGLIVFRPYLLNKLCRQRGMSLKHANRLLLKSYNKYDPLLDELFKEIINEYPDPDGFACMVLRNPTLKQSSLLYLKISQIKTDVKDKTIGLSVLLMTFLAGDFDGDQYTCQLIPDRLSRVALQSLEPASSTFSTEVPGEINGVITLTKTSATIIASYIRSNELRRSESKQEIEVNNIFDLL